MAWVGRKYKLERSENFGDYMKALGKALLQIENFFLFNCEQIVWWYDVSIRDTPSHTIRPTHKKTS